MCIEISISLTKIITIGKPACSYMPIRRYISMSFEQIILRRNNEDLAADELIVPYQFEFL